MKLDREVPHTRSSHPVLQSVCNIREHGSPAGKTSADIIGFALGGRQNMAVVRSSDRLSGQALSPNLETSLMALKLRVMLANGIITGLSETMAAFQNRLIHIGDLIDKNDTSEIRALIQHEAENMRASLLATSSDLLRVLNEPLCDDEYHPPPTLEAAQRRQQRQYKQRGNA